MAEEIAPITEADKGSQVGGKFKAAQSRAPAGTPEERQTALRLGQEAASQLIRGTIQKNREQEAEAPMTPLPETDVIGGTPVDIGYDPDQWTAFEQESRTYERRAMGDIARQPKIDALSASVNPYERAASEINPSFFKMMTDSEFWRRDVAPRVVNAGKGIAANTMGAPADMAVLGAHTLRYIYEKRKGTGDYGFLKDMPDFENVPLTGDWIGANLMAAQVDSPEFMVSGFLSPDLKDVALASKALTAMAGSQINQAMILGGIGFSSDVARTTDVVESQQKLRRFQDFLDGEKVADPSGAGVSWDDQEALWQETGFWRGPDNQMRWWLPDDQIKWAEPEDIGKFISPDNEVVIFNNIPGLEGHTMHTIPIADIMGHDELFEIYPALRNLEIDVAFKKLTPDMRSRLPSNRTIYTGADGHEYIIDSPARFLAAVVPGASVSEYDFYVAASRNIGDLRSTVLHEVQHVVQGIEAMAKGGSVTEFEGMAQDLAHMQATVFNTRLFELMQESSIDASDAESIQFLIDSDGPLQQVTEALGSEGYTINMAQIQLRMANWAENGNLMTRTMFRSEVRKFRQYMRAAEGANMSTDDALEWIRKNTVLPYTPQSLYLSLAGEIESRFTQEVYEKLGEDVVQNTFPKQLIEEQVSFSVAEPQQIVKQEAAVELK